MAFPVQEEAVKTETDSDQDEDEEDVKQAADEDKSEEADTEKTGEFSLIHSGFTHCESM